MRREVLMGAFEKDGLAVVDLSVVRRARGIVQRDVAYAMGVSTTTVSRMEDDPSSMSLGELLDYARAIGLTPADLLAVEPVYGRRWAFVVAVTPRTKRGADKGNHGQMHPDTGTVAYEQLVAGAASDAGLCAGAGPVAVTVTLHLPTKARKDADRVLTAIFDGLKRAGKAALADDNLMVIQRTNVILGGIDRMHPRAEIVVREIRGVA